jgi:hypothetical protein
MAGILIHDVSGYTGEKYNLKIPSLTDPANIQEAMMLFHYGIDSYDGSIEPADASVFGNLRDFDNRIAQLEETEVVQLEGTVNQIVSSGSVGFVTLSLPSSIITPGSLQTTTNFIVGGSASFTGAISGNSTLQITGTSTLATVNASSGSVSGNFTTSGSATFDGTVLAKNGTNIFTNSTQRDTLITSPVQGTVIYLNSTNSQQVYDGSSWKNIEDSGTLQSKFDSLESLALLGL